MCGFHGRIPLIMILKHDYAAAQRMSESVSNSRTQMTLDRHRRDSDSAASQNEQKMVHLVVNN